jgi:septin family protein
MQPQDDAEANAIHAAKHTGKWLPWMMKLWDNNVDKLREQIKTDHPPESKVQKIAKKFAGKTNEFVALCTAKLAGPNTKLCTSKLAGPNTELCTSKLAGTHSGMMMDGRIFAGELAILFCASRFALRSARQPLSDALFFAAPRIEGVVNQVNSAKHRLQQLARQVIVPQEENDSSVPSNIIFCGNPGSGKSTLLNSLIGAVRFESGVSLGEGLTKESEVGLPTQRSGGRSFIDTPGLSDAAMREKAAEEIRKAFKIGGKYSLCFVLTLQAGRVMPEDLTTIELVLTAVPDILDYGLIFNKVSEPVLAQIREKGEKALLDKVFRNFKCKTTEKVFFNPENEALRDRDNVLAEASPDLWKFVDSVNSQKVNSTQKLATDKYEIMQQQHERAIANMREMNDELRRELREMRQKYEEQRIENILSGNFQMAGNRGRLAKEDPVKKVGKWFARGLCADSGFAPAGAEGTVVGPGDEVKGRPTVLVRFEESEEQLWYHQIQKLLPVPARPPLPHRDDFGHDFEALAKL